MTLIVPFRTTRFIISITLALVLSIVNGTNQIDFAIKHGNISSMHRSRRIHVLSPWFSSSVSQQQFGYGNDENDRQGVMKDSRHKINEYNTVEGTIKYRLLSRGNDALDDIADEEEYENVEEDEGENVEEGEGENVEEDEGEYVEEDEVENVEEDEGEYVEEDEEEYAEEDEEEYAEEGEGENVEEDSENDEVYDDNVDEDDEFTEAYDENEIAMNENEYVNDEDFINSNDIESYGENVTNERLNDDEIISADHNDEWESPVNFKDMAPHNNENMANLFVDKEKNEYYTNNVISGDEEMYNSTDMKEDIALVNDFNDDNEGGWNDDNTTLEKEWNYDENSTLSEDDEDEDEDDDGLKGVQIGKLYRGYDGTTLIEMWVGQPPQRQYLIVDSTTGQTALSCTNCDGDDCEDSESSESFKTVSSSSFHELDCSECSKHASGCSSDDVCLVDINFEENRDWSGIEASDLFSITDTPLEAEHSPRVTFSCRTDSVFPTTFKNDNGEPITVNGIFGVSRNSNFIRQVDRESFSICLATTAHSSVDGSAGFLTFGAPNERLHRQPMRYAKMLRGVNDAAAVVNRLYSVRIDRMYLQSQTVDIMSGQRPITPIHFNGHDFNVEPVVIDTSSQDTYFIHAGSGNFRQQWVAIAGRKYTNEPIKLTAKELHALPTLMIQLMADPNMDRDSYPTDTTGFSDNLDRRSHNDVLLFITASQYMQYDAATRKYTNTIYLDSKRGNVLGANVLQKHLITFDVKRRRIGFSTSECDLSVILAHKSWRQKMIEREEHYYGPAGMVRTSALPFGREKQQEPESVINGNCLFMSCQGALALVATFSLFSATILLRMLMDSSRRRKKRKQQEDDEVWFDMDLSFHEEGETNKQKKTNKNRSKRSRAGITADLISC